MSFSLNNFNIVGRVGRDPEVKYFESGKVVTKFTVAVNQRRKDAPPNWFDVEVWEKTAEIAANYLKKGSLVGVEGTLTLDTWTDKATGVARSKPFVRGEQIHLLGSRGDNAAPAPENIEF